MAAKAETFKAMFKTNFLLCFQVDFKTSVFTSRSPLSQLHEQFISPITLVKFNWYCESGSDNDKALT